MSSINQFPWQEQILLYLGANDSASIEALTGHLAADGGDVDSLRKQVSDEVEHLVLIDLARYTGGDQGQHRTVELTDRGRESAASLVTE